MNNSYFDLIQTAHTFPQDGFELKAKQLHFHGIDLKALVRKYGTPFKITYLPRIGQQIQRAKHWFATAMQAHNYQGRYFFCYCTKCNHFYHVLEEALKHNVHLETSSSFDIDLVLRLYQSQQIDKKTILIHNGYKTKDYLTKVQALRDAGFINSMVILDNRRELHRLLNQSPQTPYKIGLRMAMDGNVQANYATSRLGIPHSELLEFYEQDIHNNPQVQLRMLHFFMDTGIEDSIYYWQSFQRALECYAALCKRCETLTAFNIGGGFPIRNHLRFRYDYQGIIEKMIQSIQRICQQEGIPEPDIFTEFGKFTVGEAGAIVFEVLEHKQQNDKEAWYIINNSLMNTIPDAWSIHEKFLLLPLNKWDKAYQRVHIGGISCDQADYYNSEDFNQEILLPVVDNEEEEPLYLGFFHTGAYQDAISGYGGIKHCLIPSPKHVIVHKDANGHLVDQLYRDEQTVDDMFRILGY